MVSDHVSKNNAVLPCSEIHEHSNATSVYINESVELKVQDQPKYLVNCMVRFAL